MTRTTTCDNGCDGYTVCMGVDQDISSHAQALLSRLSSDEQTCVYGTPTQDEIARLEASRIAVSAYVAALEAIDANARAYRSATWGSCDEETGAILDESFMVIDAVLMMSDGLESCVE